MKIIGTGLSGLVGSRVTELLSPEYSFENYSLETGVDITDESAIRSRIRQSDAPWMFHFAAYTNVQGAEAERALGSDSAAWKVNVIATEHIAKMCRETGKHLIYIDTDYAFDGAKKEYTESDAPNPQGWYAMTKYEGAKRVLALDTLGLVIRISNPYRANPVGKKDFAHKILERLQANQEIVAATDQLFVPTFIDDIAVAVDTLVKQNATGIYHVVGSSALSPYDAAAVIAQTYGCPTELVKKTSFQTYFAGRAPVPQWAALTNDKITKLGVVMHSFADGMKEVKKQESQ
jgi:dTDP-4-dehydrorhamnose reductase